MRFFFDRCFPIRVARKIGAYEISHTIRHHDDDSRFEPTTKDVEWITALGRDDPVWIVISGDGRILRNRAERQVLLETALIFFCMARTWLHTPAPEYAWKFVKVWPEVVESAAHSKARLFEVSGGRALKVHALT